MEKEIIPKLDAARRQLDTAIMLWFQEGDPIAIHTLTCAAYQIVHDINRHRNGPALMFDSIIVKDEYRHLIKKHLNKDYNFFKHADNDPDENLEFNSATTEYFIIFCILGLESLGIRNNNVRFTFSIFFAIRHPDLVGEKWTQLIKDNIPLENLNSIRHWKRRQFFERFNLILSETMP
ncbi:MAG: hypothetical protein HY808_09535 [Nitrospirae bacterium]|nr:hypothetical protein [Nitrospirota bacterium]